MADDIRIVSWPEDELGMKHRFDPDEPCPVSVSFDPKTPVNVAVASGETPISVDMDMHVRAKEPLPLCFSICEPICAKSDYTVSFDIFDQPVGRILVRGVTRIFNCKDDGGSVEPDPVEICTDFQRRKDGESFTGPVSFAGATFEPVTGGLKIITWGNPAGRNKLAFESDGVKITLPQPSDSVGITLINGFGQSLNVSVLRDGTEIESRVENVDMTPTRVDISGNGITGLVVSGGGNEAAVVELCWTASNTGGYIG